MLSWIFFAVKYIFDFANKIAEARFSTKKIIDRKFYCKKL